MRRTRIRSVSRKRARENRQRKKLIETYGPLPECRVRWNHECTGRADDLHELLSRARGGSISDPNNTIPVCRACHRNLTEHPAEAERLGWAQSRKGKHVWLEQDC